MDTELTTSVDQAKDRIQRGGCDLWYNNGERGCLVHATGSGKTRCGVLAAEHVLGRVPNARILILTWMTTIRDRVWRDEFYKWGLGWIYEDHVESVCVQTAYKWSEEHFDLVIADEFHALLSEEYIAFFHNNSMDRIMALTAYLPPEKLDMARSIDVPVVSVLSLKKARELGIISEEVEYVVPIDMDTGMGLKYQKAQEGIQEAMDHFGSAQNAFKRAMYLMKKYKGIWTENVKDPKEREDLEKGRKFMRLTQSRNQMLYKATAKVDVVSNILDWDDFGPSIIFFMSNKAVKNLCDKRSDCLPYNSWNSGPSEDDNLDKWIRGEARHLVTCKKLNEGIDIPKVNYAIMAGFNSRRKDKIQRTGRVLRRSGNNRPVVIDLYFKGTQELGWLKRSLGQDEPRVHWLNSMEDLEQIDLNSS